jgi:hypothetical protein
MVMKMTRIMTLVHRVRLNMMTTMESVYSMMMDGSIDSQIENDSYVSHSQHDERNGNTSRYQDNEDSYFSSD